MKVTYVEAADTWVIGHVSDSEETEAKNVINSFKFSSAKYVVIPGDFEVKTKESNTMLAKSVTGYQPSALRNKANIGETHKDSPIYEPDVVHDLEMIVGCLSDATKNGSYMVVVPERIIKTDIEKLYKVLQIMGVGCFIQHCYSDSILENTRALRIFNDKEGINL